MARAAVRQGIRTIIATPHHNNGVYKNEPAAVREAADQLNKRLIKEDIPLHVPFLCCRPNHLPRHPLREECDSEYRSCPSPLFSQK